MIIITEMRDTLKGMNSRLDKAKDQISDLKNKVAENIQSEKKNKKQKNEDSLSDLWSNIKHNNIRIVRVPEGEERAKDWDPIWRNND